MLIASRTLRAIARRAGHTAATTPTRAAAASVTARRSQGSGVPATMFATPSHLWALNRASSFDQ